VPAWGKWYAWAGDRWHIDDMGAIEWHLQKFLQKLERSRECNVMSPAARRKLPSMTTVAAVQTALKTRPAIATAHTLLDAEPYLLGVPGGAVDLKTGAMLPARPEQLITKQCAVQPGVGEPYLWMAFLDQVLMGRTDQIQFLRRFAGYCLVGALFEPGLAFLHGSGANGKGVILNTLRGILGDYAVSADFATFAEQGQTERHSTDIARLAGARLVVTEEGKEGQGLNDALVKKLTGGGKITARFIAQDNFEFDFKAKILIASNHKPSLRSVGEDMIRRINLVPMDYIVPEKDRDQYLEQKLREEWPQILNWIIGGCMLWQEEQLSPPESIKAASRGYIQAQDVVADFIKDTCAVGRGSETPAAVYRAWRKWAESVGERDIPRRKFMDRVLTRPGINLVRTSQGEMVEGLQLTGAWV
jgi:putative DNA primase/helicase